MNPPVETPKIPPLSLDGRLRSFWSVMVPTYNPRADYLEETLWSILQQDLGPEQMQIEVVDDCSPEVDVKSIVDSIAKGRVTFSNTPKNLGLAGCWNTCIERARGEWVHILHQDDYVLPGFYKKLELAAKEHPEIGLLATRSFIVDKENIILGVTPRLRELENGGRRVDDFYYNTPIQCPGVAVKRTVYETRGGFLNDLVFMLDREMWARAIGYEGGVVTPEVLSSYRAATGSETGRLFRTGESLRDMERLHQIFANRYPAFDRKLAARRLSNWAYEQAATFARDGNREAAKASLDYWKANTPAQLRLRKFAIKLAKNLFT